MEKTHDWYEWLKPGDGVKAVNDLWDESDWTDEDDENPILVIEAGTKGVVVEVAHHQDTYMVKFEGVEDPWCVVYVPSDRDCCEIMPTDKKNRVKQEDARQVERTLNKLQARYGTEKPISIRDWWTK